MQFAKEGEDKNIDLLLFPECFLSGYILDESYRAAYAFDFESEQFAEVLNELKNVKPVLVFGLCEKQAGKLYNSAVVVDKGKIVGVYRKMHLIGSNELFFTAGTDYPIFEVKGLKYGINICYDTQFADAEKALADQGARALLSPAQNMLRRKTAEYWKDKHSEIVVKRVEETGLWFVRSDITGVRPPGQYGVECPTLAMNPKAEIVAQVPLMTVGMITVDIDLTDGNT